MAKPVNLKKFNSLYPDYTAFRDSVWNNVLKLVPTGNNMPIWCDPTKMFYTPEMIFSALEFKYGEFIAVNEESRQHKIMALALVNLLPSLHVKSLALTQDVMASLDPLSLLTTLETRYNDDPENKFASSETTYSSTPADQASGSFQMQNGKEKNITLRKDATKRVREIRNILDKYASLKDINTSGLLLEFINSIEFSSMWEYYDEEQIVYVAGKDGRDGVDGAKGDKGDKGDPGDVSLQQLNDGLNKKVDILTTDLPDPADDRINSYLVYRGNGTMIPISEKDMMMPLKTYTINGDNKSYHDVVMGVGALPGSQYKSVFIPNSGIGSNRGIFLSSLDSYLSIDDVTKEIRLKFTGIYKIGPYKVFGSGVVKSIVLGKKDESADVEFNDDTYVETFKGKVIEYD